MVTAKKPTTTRRKTTKKEEKFESKEAEGRTAIQMGASLADPAKVSPDNVGGFLCNLHVAKQLNTHIIQVFPEPPRIEITDSEGETDEELTKEYTDLFWALNGYELMQYVIYDTWSYGAFVYSVGFQLIENKYVITEIRHIPAAYFSRPPMTMDMYNITPNPLMPGIIVNKNDEVEAWAYNRASGITEKLNNVSFVKMRGTPAPSGAAHLYPVYFIIAQMDYAREAQMQQLSRIGAPRITPKVADDCDDDEYKALRQWFQSCGKFMDGKSNAILLPPGIEFPTLNNQETNIASEFVNTCVEWIRNYCNPMSDLTSANGLGTSDSGRMEMWVNFLSSEQEQAEGWLEDLFEMMLRANGYDGYKCSINLRRPSIDRAEMKLKYLEYAVANKVITKEEARKEVSDQIEIEPTLTDEIKQQLEEDYPAQQQGYSFMNTVTATPAERKNVSTLTKELEDIYADAEREIAELLNGH